MGDTVPTTRTSPCETAELERLSQIAQNIELHIATKKNTLGAIEDRVRANIEETKRRIAALDRKIRLGECG